MKRIKATNVTEEITAKIHSTSSISQLLYIIHLNSTIFPTLIRDLICQECGWSIPTYYRKIRNTLSEKSKLKPCEKETIMRIVKQTLNQFTDSLSIKN